MSQKHRAVTVEGNSVNNSSCNDKQQKQPNNTEKKKGRKRGRINVNACLRCRRDKKKCDGNYSTRECCRYCRHHKSECIYPEPGRRRIIKVEKDLIEVTELLKSNMKYYIQQIFFRLLFNKSTTIEQTLLLRKLWILVYKTMNYPACTEEYLRDLHNKLQLLEHEREDVRSHMWKGIQNFVDKHNEISGNKQPPAPSLHTTKPSIPQPQLQEHSQISPELGLSTGNIYAPVYNVTPENTDATFQVVNDPTLISQTMYDDKIVPSQRISRIRKDNYQLKHKDYQGEKKEASWTENNTIEETFNDYNLSPNLISNIDTCRIFSTNLSHNNTQITVNNVTNNHFQNLSNGETNFLHSPNTSPLFPSENFTTPTTYNLQTSTSYYPLTHSYGMISPTNPIIDYRQQIHDRMLFGIEEQYPTCLQSQYF